MTPKHLAQFLSRAIPARLPILITGAPGIGKTSILEQAAAASGADVILSHPAVADPTDAKGLPWAHPGANEATFLPFGELAAALKSTKPTVWFLDDIGQASPAVQSSFMMLLLARRVNGHKLPDHVTFVAATNRRTDRAGVSGILEPVKSRFTSIVELEANLDDWCQWAMANGLPSTLVAFLRFKPDLLSNFQATADLTNSPCPRTWANLAKIDELGLPAHVESPAMAGSVGEGAAVEYLAFRKMAKAMVSLDAILLDPDKYPIPTQPAELYAVSVGLASKANGQNFDRVGRYAERLRGEKKGEFAALILRDAVRRSKNKEIENSAAFIKVVSGPLGKLISGVID